MAADFRRRCVARRVGTDRRSSRGARGGGRSARVSPRQPGMTVAESVAAALEGRSRLLVFDNCEHLVDAAASMAEAILSRSPTVKVLATSREGLRVADEQLVGVPAMDLSGGIDSTAATLFLERARGVSAGVALTGTDDAEAVWRSVGAWTEFPWRSNWPRPPAVDDGRRGTRPARRPLPTVGGICDAAWSVTRPCATRCSGPTICSSDAEKSLLSRCSVFAGGFDLAGVRAVGDSADEFTTLDLLDALVRKSLLVADRSSGRTRFSILETIRQFAEEQLVATGSGR